MSKERYRLYAYSLKYRVNYVAFTCSIMLYFGVYIYWC